MKRYIFMALAICCFCQSTAEAQRGGLLREVAREFGGQFIEQQIRGMQQGRRPSPPPQQGTPQPQIQSYGGMALPSEGGNNSGGGQEGFRPDLGFMLERPSSQPQPRPQYVQPRPQYVQPQPQYAQPQQNLLYTDPTPQNRFNPGYEVQPGSSTQPFTTSQPVVTRSVTTAGDLPSSPVMTNQYVVIRCPAEILGSIRYTLTSAQGSYSFTMSGGQEQRFKVNNPWSISYNDGSATRRYALRGGITYTMKRRTDNNWQLYSTKSPGS